MQKLARYQLLSEDLIEEIEGLDKDHQSTYLFLDPSNEFQGRWAVSGLYPTWFFEFDDLVGRYKTISPAKLDPFLTRAEELNYSVVFNEPPEEILGAYEHLNDPPPFEIKSSLENTINGMFPWQISAFNKLVKDESIKAGLVCHSTGTGKTVFIASALLWHLEHGHPFDFAQIVVKSNNKADMNRKIMSLAGLDSIIIDGTPAKREKIYGEILEKLKTEKVIAITNYEKFREDPADFKKLFKGRNCLIFWDEIPTRLSNRKTKTYKAIKGIIWQRFMSKEEGLEGALPRAKWLRQWALTATPIENSPEDFFNYMRLLNPPLLGRVEEFETEYVATRNYFSQAPERWHHLDKLEAKVEHLVSRASRQDDPEIGKLFPKVIEDVLVIDWDQKDRRIYDILTGKAKDIVEADFSEANILALIQVLQMMCDAPSMINESAKNREIFEEDEKAKVRGSDIAVALTESLKAPLINDNHTKIETLREILVDKHPEEKALLFMTWSSYGFKPITKKLDEWGITYVTYEGTQNNANKAKDRFRTDPSIRVFLSSDRGADSIDLPEAAVGINYNLPWTWVRHQQRMRNVRVDSRLSTNYWYDLIMANSIEERKKAIIQKKYEYHSILFDKNAIEDTMASKLSREDLLHILFG